MSEREELLADIEKMLTHKAIMAHPGCLELLGRCAKALAEPTLESRPIETKPPLPVTQ